jgi:hypothetical protein
MKQSIVFCVFLFISLFTGPASVNADEERIVPTISTGIQLDVANSADQSKNKADLKPQVPHKQGLHSLSIRVTFSSFDVIGIEAPEEFREYDVAASFNLPWAWYPASGWGVGTRLMASAGALYSSEETALSVSLIPQIVFGNRDGKFALDMGAGGAVLSRHQFGAQDFGGNFQFALTAGISIPFFKRLALGYRFLHYSDAGLIGPDTTGADLHMLELIYLPALKAGAHLF